MHRNTQLLMAAIAAFFIAGCSEAPEPARAIVERSVPVVAEPLNFERVRARIEAIGTSRAVLSAELYPATSGEVIAVNFEPGQEVTAGDALVELDAREQKLALRLAELKLADAERLYDRYSRSANSGAVVPATLDAARTAVETARIDVESARIALADRTIEAVFTGHVGGTDVDPGDRVSNDTLITTLDDRSALLVSFDIPEGFISELQRGDTIQLATWSSAMPSVEGQIVDIGSRIDPDNRTFAARARVDNARDSLRPGMSFKVQVDLDGELYPAVSETAVQWGADGAYIWSIVDGRATRVAVQIVQRREGRVLIEGELDEDIIVVEGTQRMRDGITVSYDMERMAATRGQPAATSGGAQP